MDYIDPEGCALGEGYYHLFDKDKREC